MTQTPGRKVWLIIAILGGSIVGTHAQGEYTVYLKDSTDPRLVYSGTNQSTSSGWLTGLQDAASTKCGGLREAWWPGESFTFTFVGTEATVSFVSASQGSTGQVQLNGTTIQEVNTVGTQDIMTGTCTLVNATTGIHPNGTQVLTVTKDSPGGSYLFVQKIDYVGESPPYAPSASSSASAPGSSESGSLGPTQSNSHSTPTGAIAGGAVGGVILILFLLFAVWRFMRRPTTKRDRLRAAILSDHGHVTPVHEAFKQGPFSPFIEPGGVIAPYDPGLPGSEHIDEAVATRAEKIRRIQASLPQPAPSQPSVTPIPTSEPPQLGDIVPYDLPTLDSTPNELNVAREHKLQQLGPATAGPSKIMMNPPVASSRPLPNPHPHPPMPTAPPAPVPPLELIESLMELNVPNEEITAVVRRMADREAGRPTGQRMPWDDDLPPQYDPEGGTGAQPPS